MKISINNRPYYFAPQAENTKIQQSERSLQKAGGKFDAVQIHQPQTALPDDKFINTLREKIMADVSKPTPPQQLESIKSQISTHTYALNLDEVAKRMLLA